MNLAIQNSFHKFKSNQDWSFQKVSRSETNYITHGYHRYPAKFIPNIVKKLIEDNISHGNVVCDPFGGCGTTLVEAKILGVESIGFDINPIAKLITQTKVIPIKPKTLENAKNAFIKNLGTVQQVEFNHNARIKYWFDEKTLEELDKIYLAIKQIKNHNVHRFFLCAFSHILKNCSRWLMKSIKPTIDKDKQIPPPVDTFLRHLEYMIRKNIEFYNLLIEMGNSHTPTKMRIWDSTKRLPLAPNSIGIIITSPPYVTSYEYVDLHQLSLLWLSDDPDYKKRHHYSDKFDSFRKKFVGTRSKKRKTGEAQSKIAENIIQLLSGVDKRLANNVANYFLDMKKAFAEMYRILKPGGKACIIIGNTTLREIQILNAEVVAEQMQRIGFKQIKIIKREVSNKMIAPWRDSQNGRFTGLSNPDRKRVYEYEYIVIMEK
ncbi:MAG: DNA methyltransferase [Candidatus Subteraquimicrobiales bacterium]|nr:DNA methyltransferase [Candidatus Subteraquimicrobiales bacterium]